MDIGVIIEGISEREIARQPWIHHRDALARRNIRIHVYAGGEAGFQRPFDAMMIHAWQDWDNPKRFDRTRIMPLMERYATYRAAYPQTIQIILNHVDMGRRPYATPYWRVGDPVLYKTPAYDRSELAPFPPEAIWAYEKVWGEPCFASATPPRVPAGFIGTASGPRGYRQRVAAATARVGIGVCATAWSHPKHEHDALMADCRIIVCPRGWGEHSGRHWDAWLSGKPVLTDRACDSVEMIPGIRLREGAHYLVFDEPEQIPDIVREWMRPARAADLAAIAENGRRAAQGYDALACITAFFERAVHGKVVA
jgi:hypothetical protein